MLLASYLRNLCIQSFASKHDDVLLVYLFICLFFINSIYQNEKCPWLSFVKVFIRKGHQILSNAFSRSTERSIWFSFLVCFYELHSLIGAWCWQLKTTQTYDVTTCKSEVQWTSSFSGSKLRCQQSWIPFWRHQVKMYFQAYSGCWQSSVPCGSRTEVFKLPGWVSWAPLLFLQHFLHLAPGSLYLRSSEGTLIPSRAPTSLCFLFCWALFFLWHSPFLTN